MNTSQNCFCADHSSPRRGFLTGLLAVGASTFLPSCATPTVASRNDRIDIHHHAFSPAYVAELDKVGQAPPIVKNWSLAKTLDDMDKAGVGTSILSVTTPQVSFTNAANAKRIARDSNEWTAKLAGDNKGKFGSFAMLPMQSVDDALRELAYALDVLKADGIGLLSSYGDKWLGHPSFAPIMDELNRRKAILFTHPGTADCCKSILAPDIPATVIEFQTDTTRTITDILFSGTAARCPDLKFIFAHSGGLVPFLVERLTKLPIQNSKLAPRVPRGVLTELKRFYYDTAWTAHPGALASLTKLVDASQILLASDYPYRTGLDNITGLIDYGFSANDLRAIERENALRILPQYRS
jgi:6-methylsalicylate decarboxylase